MKEQKTSFWHKDSTRSVIAQHEPLPFVPATCTIVKRSWGLPSFAIRARIFSRPFLQPVGYTL